MEKRFALVIDDDPDIANWLGAVLSAQSIQVVKTGTAEEGLEMLKIRAFNFVFIDIFMPGMGGIAGIRELRSQDTAAQIIAMSGGYDGMTETAALAAAEKIGADHVLPKPLTLEAIEALIGDPG